MICRRKGAPTFSQGKAADALQPQPPTAHSGTHLSKLFLQRHAPSGCVGTTLLANVHRLHLNAEIHGLSGRPLSLHAFAPKMKGDSVLEVRTTTT